MILNDIVVKPKKTGTEIEVVIPKSTWNDLKVLCVGLLLIFIFFVVFGGLISYYRETTTTTISITATVPTTVVTIIATTIPKSETTTNYNFQFYENQEPYYSAYCDKINPYNLEVRQVASEAIRQHPGSYSTVGIDQLLDIYDWVKSNIIYQNVPLAGIPYAPSETLATKSGDCKNQAVLIASMIENIGGTAKVVIDTTCKHAYTIVYFASVGTDMQTYVNTISLHYGANLYVQWFIMNNGNWMIFDTAGGLYPGNTLPECSGNRVMYTVTSCL